MQDSRGQAAQNGIGAQFLLRGRGLSIKNECQFMVASVVFRALSETSYISCLPAVSERGEDASPDSRALSPCRT